MQAQFELTIATPERQFYTGAVESLVIASQKGLMGILPGHLSMVVALDTAPVQIKAVGEDWKVAALSGGFARIKSDRVVILADTAEWPEEIEINRAMEAKKRAEERLRLQVNEIEYMRSRVALQRALMRLDVKNRK